MTLEETLEILGAGELKMDDGRQPLINDSGVGRVKPAKSKSSRLGRLFESPVGANGQLGQGWLQPGRASDKFAAA